MCNAPPSRTLIHANRQRRKLPFSRPHLHRLVVLLLPVLFPFHPSCFRCYLVAAATRPALSACLSLHLPCYNATHLLLQPPPSDSATANATANGTQPYARWLPYMSGTWTKLLVIGEVLGALPQGVGLHFSDHDVVG